MLQILTRLVTILGSPVIHRASCRHRVGRKETFPVCGHGASTIAGAAAATDFPTCGRLDNDLADFYFETFPAELASDPGRPHAKYCADVLPNTITSHTQSDTRNKTHPNFHTPCHAALVQKNKH